MHLMGASKRRRWESRTAIVAGDLPLSEHFKKNNYQ
jgi:hypothetical protein